MVVVSCAHAVLVACTATKSEYTGQSDAGHGSCLWQPLSVSRTSPTVHDMCSFQIEDSIRQLAGSPPLSL